MINKNLCMSQFLAFRFIKNESLNFFPSLTHKTFKPSKESLIPVMTANDIDSVLNKKIKEFLIPKKTALFLSGGIDSAILASYLPAGTIAYTFKCIADGAIDESESAKRYCDKFGLNQQIVEMRWQDFEDLTPELLTADGVPFHSIEVQLLKAARQAKSQGIERIIIGDAADYIFGGMNKILAKDWSFDEFVNRYIAVMPNDVLKDYVNIKDIFEPFRKNNNGIDFIAFLKEYMDIESYTSYMHAFSLAGVEYLDPYSFMKMAVPLDLNRVRNGEPKYLIRELFSKKYPEFSIPEKIPMPRATDQWLKNYSTTRSEFKPKCTNNLSGDQKWLIWCLEKFLNMHESTCNA